MKGLNPALQDRLCCPQLDDEPFFHFWEEALDIIEEEVQRVDTTYCLGAILYNWRNIGYRHSSYFRFMDIFGATYAEHNLDR